uniref:Uncharacterized protein n=1 Tax=Oryza meridionalis TaxID=40149 RepID=A0A0E0F8I7_9ORYZ
MPNWEEWSFVEEEEEVQEEETAAAAKEGGEDGTAASKQKQKEEEALSPTPRSSWLLPCLTRLELDDCPKLRALSPQLGQQATNLKVLLIREAECLKTVEDLPFLSGCLLVERCEGLERISNLPQVRELRAGGCPNLRCVEELGGLEQLRLYKDMQDISSPWVSMLQEQHHQLNGDEHVLEVNLEGFGLQSPVCRHDKRQGTPDKMCNETFESQSPDMLEKYVGEKCSFLTGNNSGAGDEATTMAAASRALRSPTVMIRVRDDGVHRGTIGKSLSLSHSMVQHVQS